jgi:hypothetical protein
MMLVNFGFFWKSEHLLYEEEPAPTLVAQDTAHGHETYSRETNTDVNYSP